VMRLAAVGNCSKSVSDRLKGCQLAALKKSACRIKYRLIHAIFCNESSKALAWPAYWANEAIFSNQDSCSNNHDF
jgi:hypothetical protein